MPEQRGGGAGLATLERLPQIQHGQKDPALCRIAHALPTGKRVHREVDQRFGFGARHIFREILVGHMATLLQIGKGCGDHEQVGRHWAGHVELVSSWERGATQASGRIGHVGRVKARRALWIRAVDCPAQMRAAAASLRRWKSVVSGRDAAPQIRLLRTCAVSHQQMLSLRQ